MSVSELVEQLKAMSPPATATTAEKMALAQTINTHCAEHQGTLNLNRQLLRPEDIQNLCSVLKSNTSVKTLSLDFLKGNPNPLRAFVAIAALEDLLQHNSCLTTLSLCGNRILINQIVHLTMALGENPNSALTTLNLDSNAIVLSTALNPGDIGYMPFIDSLAKTKLKKISLRENGMNDLSHTGIQYLLTSTQQCPSLEEFNLDGNPITQYPQYRALIAQAIPKNQIRPRRLPNFLGSEMLQDPCIAKAFAWHFSYMNGRAIELGQELASTPLPLEAANIIKGYLEDFPGEFPQYGFEIGFKKEIPTFQKTQTKKTPFILPFYFTKKEAILFSVVAISLSALGFLAGGPIVGSAILLTFLSAVGCATYDANWSERTRAKALDSAPPPIQPDYAATSSPPTVPLSVPQQTHTFLESDATATHRAQNAIARADDALADHATLLARTQP